MTNSRGALILGANYRALGIARSLGRRGIETWLLHDPGDDQVTRASRYVGRTLRAPQGNPEQRRHGLLAIASRHGLAGWTLFPTGDESAAMIARGHAALGEHFALTSPSWDVFRYAHHKRLTHLVAQRAGTEHPWTRHPLTRTDVAALACEFPLILKPEVKPEENEFTRAKAWRVDDRASLLGAWDAATELVAPEAVMIQELIPASGAAQYSFAALCRDGVPLASLVARRTRQYPRDFGHSSSLVETVHAPRVEASGRAILRSLGWNGLVEIELMHDVRDDSLKLLDINGRVWTWHSLGPRAGVDFPYLAWRLSQGLPVEPVRAQPGVRWMRAATDVPSALGAVRAGELTLGGWLRSVRGPREPALFAADDPLPALLDPFILAWRLMLRRTGWPQSLGTTEDGCEAVARGELVPESPPDGSMLQYVAIHPRKDWNLP
jgi:D-aspartate ligase